MCRLTRSCTNRSGTVRNSFSLLEIGCDEVGFGGTDRQREMCGAFIKPEKWVPEILVAYVTIVLCETTGVGIGLRVAGHVQGVAQREFVVALGQIDPQQATAKRVFDVAAATVPSVCGECSTP